MTRVNIRLSFSSLLELSLVSDSLIFLMIRVLLEAFVPFFLGFKIAYMIGVLFLKAYMTDGFVRNTVSR